MKVIPLSGKRGRALFALIDDIDFDRVSCRRWVLLKSKYTNYATTYVGRDSWPLHRFILGLDKGDKRWVDHRDHNGLNCQRSNIWICSSTQNKLNILPRSINTHGIVGVRKRTDCDRWESRLQINGKLFHNALWKTFAEAVAARKSALEAAQKSIGMTTCQ